MSRSTLLLMALALPLGASCHTISAPEIMQRVAANQDRAQTERSAYLYEESVHVTTRRTNGKLAREEDATYLVTPTPKGIEKKRSSIKGRFWEKGHYQTFTGEPIPAEDTLDGGLTKSFRDDLLDGKSKDGLGHDLFPLTTEEQKDLKFELVSEETVAGRPAYRIRFGPKDSSDITWAGEAVIDQEEFQPISVYTRLSRRLPFFVRAMLGTDLPGFGFNTQYVRIAKDVWFPVSFGTEFRLHAVFFINRTITVSLQNTNFKHAAAESQIEYQ